MLYVVSKYNPDRKTDEFVDENGLANSDAPLFSGREAEAIAKKVGGIAIAEKDAFPQDWSDLEDD